MHRNSVLAFAALAIAGMAATPAAAVDLNSLVGTYKWTDYTVQAKTCSTNPSGAGLCVTVTAGPKNIGMEMIRSKLMDKAGGVFVGKIAHPASGEIYNTKMTFNGKIWHMDGCTDAGVCATGDFVKQ